MVEKKGPKVRLFTEEAKIEIEVKAELAEQETLKRAQEKGQEAKKSSRAGNLHDLNSWPEGEYERIFRKDGAPPGRRKESE